MRQCILWRTKISNWSYPKHRTFSNNRNHKVRFCKLIPHKYVIEHNQAYFPHHRQTEQCIPDLWFAGDRDQQIPSTVMVYLYFTKVYTKLCIIINKIMHFAQCCILLRWACVALSNVRKEQKKLSVWLPLSDTQNSYFTVRQRWRNRMV